MNKISKLLTILCFIGFGLCLTGCSDGSSSASTKGLNIYLFGAPADSHWNIWCWNKDSGTPYSSKSWDESKASGWEFSIDEIDAEKGCLVKNLNVPKSATLGLLFVNDKGDKQTADITVLTSVLKNAHELYFVYGLTEFYTSFDDIAGIKNATISSADGKELSGSIYGYTELAAEEVSVTGSDGTVYPVSAINITGNKYSITLTDGDISNIPYAIEYNGVIVKANPSCEVIDSSFGYEENDLGLTINGSTATFKCWAPYASTVELLLFADAASLSTATETIQMTPSLSNKAIFVAENVNFGSNKYYKYKITNGTTESTVCDIWNGVASADSVASQIVDINDPSAKPADWESSYVNPFGNSGTVTKKYSDAVIYEMHIRDWSRAFVADSTGKFRDITNNLKNSGKFAEHLNDLGITHVQILPMFDYAQTNADKNYNWGYNPYHYNVPEGRYVDNMRDGTDAVIQMREMIKAFHDAGISVIMDVVYNHTSGTGTNSLYDKTVPKYFYRLDEYDSYINGSGCGNEIATNHKMARKYVIDSLKHWMKDYHINGFRFDLMGCLESDTMKEIYEALYAIDKNVLVYGEPWTGGTSGVIGSADKAGEASVGYGFGAFDDSFRNAIKGAEFGGFQKGQVQGTADDNNIIKGLKASTSRNATNIKGLTIHYAECHDNYTLFDKLAMSILGMTKPNKTKLDLFAALGEEKLSNVIKQDKLAAAYIFLAQGTPFINGGQEFLRTKKGNPDSYAADTKGGITWTNTAGNLNIDDVNTINLSMKETYSDVYNTYKGLIALRKANPEAFGSNEDAIAERVLVKADATTKQKLVTRYATGDFLIFFNAGDTDYTVVDGDILKVAEYPNLIDVSSGKVSPSLLSASKLIDPETGKLNVPAKSFVILKK